MGSFLKYLQGGDLRSIAKVPQLLPLIRNQSDFDRLFGYMSSKDRLLKMRAADAIEKITLDKTAFLQGHKQELIHFLDTAKDKEFKWHLVLLVSRLELSHTDLERVWPKLTEWATDKSESKIVRVNALQALYELAAHHKKWKKNMEPIVQQLENENIPSINARLKKLKGNAGLKK